MEHYTDKPTDGYAPSQRVGGSNQSLEARVKRLSSVVSDESLLFAQSHRAPRAVS